MELEQLRDKLTPKQAKFCLLFVQEGDTKTATECAILAGYSEKRARIEASELRKHPGCTEYIRELRNQEEKKYEINLHKHLKRLDQLSRKCITSKANLKGQFKQALDFKLIDEKFYNEHTDSDIRFNNLKLENLHFNSIKKEILDRDVLFDE